MPTDESYLDNLLKGLSSDQEEQPVDRLAAYKKNKSTVEPDKKADEFFETEETTTQAEIGSSEGEIQNYSIFEDYDDDVMDKIIEKELSGNDTSGELFSMSEDNNDLDEAFGMSDQEADLFDGIFDNMLNSKAPEEGTEEDTEEESDEISLDGFVFDEPEALTEEPAGDYQEDIGLEELSEDGTEATDGFSVDDNAQETVSDELQSDGTAADGFEDFVPEPIYDFGANDVSDETDAAPDGDLLLSEDFMSDVNNIADGSDSSESDVSETDAAPGESDFDLPELDLSVLDQGTETADTAGVTEEFTDDGFVFDQEDGETSIEEGLTEISSDDSEIQNLSGDDLADIFGNSEEVSDSDFSGLEGLFNEFGEDSENEEAEETPKKKIKKPKEKLPWYLALFGNVKIPENKIKPELSEEEIAKKKEEKKAEVEARKAAAKAEKDEKAKLKAEEKQAKERQSKEEKDAIKAQKRAKAEALLLEDTGNTTRINPYGAAIIFALFIAIAALIFGLQSVISYNSGIRKASEYFDNALKYQDVDYYTKAYNKIYGLDIDEDSEDYDLFDKIVTINFVNKQITSFNSHMKLGSKTDALNDLFKGLQMQRKWFAHATALGVQDDMKFVRSVIYKALLENFGITEEEAMSMLSEYDIILSTKGKKAADSFYSIYLYERIEDLKIGDSEE